MAQAPDISKGKQWDAKRTAKMGAFGLALHGPIGHYWYGFLDRTIMVAAPTSAAAVATKTAIDQILWAPVFTSMFFGAMKVMDGKVDEIPTEISEKLWPTMKVNWTVYVSLLRPSFLHGCALSLSSGNSIITDFLLISESTCHDSCGSIACGFGLGFIFHFDLGPSTAGHWLILSTSVSFRPHSVSCTLTLSKSVTMPSCPPCKPQARAKRPPNSLQLRSTLLLLRFLQTALKNISGYALYLRFSL